MKPRRNFVVQIKSNRRQKRKQGTSIWGDTDLKAISQDVENELPKPGPGSSSSPSLQKTPSVQVPNGDLGDAGVTNVELLSDKLPREVSAPRIIQALPQTAAEPEAKPIPTGNDRSSVPLMYSLQKPANSRRPRQQTGISKQASSPSFAELAELEAENRHLKVLLRSQLQAENQKLREMLAHQPLDC